MFSCRVYSFTRYGFLAMFSISNYIKHKFSPLVWFKSVLLTINIIINYLNTGLYHQATNTLVRAKLFKMMTLEESW